MTDESSVPSASEASSTSLEQTGLAEKILRTWKENRISAHGQIAVYPSSEELARLAAQVAEEHFADKYQAAKNLQRANGIVEGWELRDDTIASLTEELRNADFFRDVAIREREELEEENRKLRAEVERFSK